MSKFFRKYFKGGVTKIPKEMERTFFFYATVIVVIIYIGNRFFGDVWFR